MTPETKELLEHAASLQGLTASEFVLAASVAAARDVVNRLEITRLAPADRDAFIAALDAEPSTELVGLLRDYKKAKSHGKRR